MPRKNFKTLRKQLVDQVGEDRVRAIEKRAEQEYEYHRLRLSDVRHAQELTQTQLARTLGVSQAQISRIESQGDLYLSTLASYIEAMGGELELTAVFDNHRIELAIGEDIPPAAPDLMEALEESIAGVKPRDVVARTRSAVMEELKDDAATRKTQPRKGGEGSKSSGASRSTRSRAKR